MRQTLVRVAAGVFVAVALASFLPAVAHAQTGKITGVVRDPAGEPLEGTELFIEGTGLTTFTASNGRFFFLSVPPGTYTLTARRIGHQTVSQRGIIVSIDVTREVNFTLAAAEGPALLREIVVEAPAVPLVQPGVSNSTVGITGDVIRALPVTSVEGALKLQQGFLQVPDNTDIISYTESRRNVTNPVRIRGGRGGETVTLIDGIPVNNWIYGGPAISITPEAVQQLDYLKGGFEPQYGNALSGVVNIATRDGGTNLAGSLRYQTSRFGGALGNTADDLQEYDLMDGYLSGPIPGLANKLRFMVAGRQQRGADAVYEFDNSVRDPSVNGTSFTYGYLQPNAFDVYPGWRAFGFNSQRDVFAKLTYFFQPAMKLGVSYTDYRAQRSPFDFTFLLTYDDPLSSPIIDNEADSVALIGNRTGDRLEPLTFAQVPQGSIEATRSLVVARFDHVVGRTSYGIAVGRFKLERKTCNFWQGACLDTTLVGTEIPAFADPNFTDDQFISPKNGSCDIHPTCGTDALFGGETLRSTVLRGDIQSQLSDHHNVQAGVMGLFHDVALNETENIGTNEVILYPKTYGATPWDLALYVQDKIEYDFLTVKLGLRYDLGSAGGAFWNNALDPTNGTQADDVCANPTDPRWQNATVGLYDPARGVYDTVLSANPAWAGLGINCVDPATGQISPATLDSARLIAASDDLGESRRRRQFSPRIGVSFPLGPSSAVFFNFGRYTQNPLLNNLYISTGIGTPREGSIQGPQLFTPSGGAVTFVGNSNLLTEQTTAYEVGYAAELGQDYGVSLVLFSKDQIGLTGLRTGGTVDGVQVFDPGATYGSTAPSYRILVNQDFQTVRGFEVQLRRRVSNHWGFDLNYSFSESRTNASDPEREIERQIEQGDPRLNQEVRSDIDQPHVFNAALLFQWGRDVPRGWLGQGLKNLSTSVVFRAQSGLPYTPTLTFTGQGLSQLVRNTGRGPATYQIDLSLSKNFAISNVRYGFILQVLNVTDRKNCIQVYTTSGTCTTGTVDQGRRREGNTIDLAEVTTTYLDRAQYFGQRRSFQAGVRVSF